MSEYDDLDEEFSGIGLARNSAARLPYCFARNQKTGNRCKNLGRVEVDGAFYCEKHAPVHAPHQVDE